jgi:hypothetical protein
MQNSLAFVVFSTILGFTACKAAKSTQSDQQTATLSAETQSTTCPTLSCGFLEFRTVLIPEDSVHCAVECCRNDGFYVQKFVPWVNKTTGKTDKWYDTSVHKLVDVP